MIIKNTGSSSSFIDNIHNPEAAKKTMYDIFLGQIKITKKKMIVGIVEKTLSTAGVNPNISIPIKIITLAILNLLSIFFSPLYQFNLLDSKNSKKTMKNKKETA